MIILKSSSRRDVLKGAAVLAGATLPPFSGQARPAMASLGAYPFTLGIASGDSAADGFVIWTRLAPDWIQPDGGMPSEAVEVEWQVAESETFGRLAASGTAIASPAWGHSVHVEIEGLKPNRHYWYRFRAGGEVSPVGRTRTAPLAGADIGALRACFMSCQQYELGHYAAYRHMVADDPDLVLFLGDYIYSSKPGVKDHVRLHRNPQPVDLDGYRIRYATYKSDPHLQAAHLAAPWLAIWDDHEVANDYGGLQTEDDVDPALFLHRRMAAYQAYYEHMPLRRSSLPTAGGMPIYRSLDWGALAQFQLVDDRQYRPARACEAEANGKLIPDCAERRDPGRSILGRTQEEWLLERLATSPACWNILTQQTLFGPLHLRDTPEQMPDLFSRDGWDGYPASRDRIVQRWTDAQVSNPLILGGDIHTFVAGDVMDARGAVVASEFVGGSISSLGRGHAAAQQVHEDNPRLAMFDSSRRGYGRLDFTKERSEITFRSLVDARDPASPLAPDVRFVVEDGRKGLQGA